MGGKVMFSAVNGQVVQNGKPVAGAKVVRQYVWQWNDKKVVEEVSTDNSGNFSFKQATQSSFLTSIFPHEPVVSQDILIFHEDKKYEAWVFSKHNYDDNGELGKPINLICELTDKPGRHVSKDVYGICRQK